MASHSNARGELYGVQILRAVAALLVVIHHTLEESNGAQGRFSPDWVTTGGASGVDLFFVISGFIMMYVTFRGKITTGPVDFLRKRFYRIYPIYWVFCVIVLLLSSIGLLKSNRIFFLKVLSSFLLIPGPKLLGVSWTLVYEVYFYLVFGALLIFRSATVSLFFSIFVIILAICTLPTLTYGEVEVFFSSYLPLEFCFGTSLGYLYLRWSEHWHRFQALLVIGILALALMLVAPTFITYEKTSGLPDEARAIAWGIPSILVLAGSLTIIRADSRSARLMVLIGNASYSLYLSHQFVMLGYARALKIHALSQINQLPIVILVVIVAVLVGILTHLMLEQPLIRWMRDLKIALRSGH